MSFYVGVIKVLKEHGYTFERQGKGSHEIWCKKGKNCVTVAVTCKSRHTANEVFKGAGIKHKI